MEGENTILEPTTDHHETEEHIDEPLAETTEQAVQVEHTASAENTEPAEEEPVVEIEDDAGHEQQAEAEVEATEDAEEAHIVSEEAEAEAVSEPQADELEDVEHAVPEARLEEEEVHEDEEEAHDEHKDHELYEEQESVVEHSEADLSVDQSADAHSERTDSAISQHEEEAHYDREEHDEHDVSMHEGQHQHELDQEDEENAVEEEDADQTSAHDRLQQALADTETNHDGEDTRRSSTSSSRSATSTRRTSLRTEALIQAAARAVVAKINGHEAESADFDILNAISESPTAPEDRQSDVHEEAADHTTTDEEVDYENELGEDDDVFSNRSHRTSLGSFEHNSGVSNNGSEYGHHKKDDTSRSIAEVADAPETESEQEEEDDYGADTGSISYHEDHRSPRMSTVSAVSKGPRISDVTGISHMSQYDRHHRDDEESHHDGEDYIPHTIRGAPRPAFRTPSSVRAIQMSSPSPSVIFGVSPRSAARRRRVGTGEGVDDGQSMGSVATYSSLPNSPSKQSTPTRFKVFRRPEPAPLVLLHATIMPTRWGWSDVLRSFDEMMSHPTPKHTSDESSSAEDIPADLSAFEPSAALKRLHNTWCQLQEYSLGADTVTERGVLLPHPQNDYEVLEERLLEALELPVRRRARILECGHYLGPADADDDDDDEDYDYYDEENGDDEEDSSSKRHWCSTCRSDIRYESLGAERVFRVKVYASNGLMTVGAWDACWREMERVDVEIEPIVADPSLQRELNLLRNLQQQDAYRRQLEEEEQERQAMHAEEEEAEAEAETEEDVVSEQGEPLVDQHPEHVEHVDTREAVDHSHLAPPTLTPASPPLHDSLVEPPATTAIEHYPEADHRRLAAEERLREIYGRTPPQPLPRTMSLPPQMEHTATMSAAVGTALTTTYRGMHEPHSYGPPSPGAEAYEHREERRHRQYSSPGPSDRGYHEYGGPAPAYPPHPAGHHYNYNHGHPQHPYESASLPELLLAAVRVFLRDRKHVAITVLSVVVIVLATLRAPSAGSVDGTTVAPVVPKTVIYQPIVDRHEPVPVAVTTTVFRPVVEDMAASVVAKVDTEVETVVEKMTVKVFETVTEVATETAVETSTATSTTTATQIATTTTTETLAAEPIESTPTDEPAMPAEATAVAAEQAEATCEATVAVFAAAALPTSAAEVVLAK